MAKKKTPAQHFAQLFALFTAGATEGERAAAERKMDAWLKRHGKTRADIAAILVQAAADEAASQPLHRDLTHVTRRQIHSIVQRLLRSAWSRAS